MKTLYFFTHFFLKKIDTFSLMSAKGLNDLELQLDDYIFACTASIGSFDVGVNVQQQQQKASSRSDTLADTPIAN